MNYVEKSVKYITIERNDEISVKKFIDELKLLNIDAKITESTNNNPKENYNLFSMLIKYAKDKHLPPKNIKYNLKKHKKSKWITNGLLNSINTKDKLYKTFIQTNMENEVLYNTLKEEYKLYRATLRRSIREASLLYENFSYMRQ